jgi:hypothetical protein
MLVLSLIFGASAWVAKGELLHGLTSAAMIYAFLVSTLAVGRWRGERT